MSTATIDHNQALKSHLGMSVALISFAMLFATLFLFYALYRGQTTGWPPEGIKPTLFWPIVSSVIILGSSFSYQRISQARAFYWITLALGLIFFITQVMVWNSLKAEGLTTSSGVYASLLYAFTWIHVAHMVAAIIALSWLGFGELKTHRYKAVGRFWHFLTIVWFLIFFALFVF